LFFFFLFLRAISRKKCFRGSFQKKSEFHFLILTFLVSLLFISLSWHVFRKFVVIGYDGV
jgi:hypothetical protein